MTAREIAEAARHMDAAVRTDYLKRACAGDAKLEKAVLRCLMEEEQATQEFTEKTVESPKPIQKPDAPGVVGPYTLVAKIGEGGMGVVYRARQTHPIRREVALKVIKPGMDSEMVIARFEGERQSLAMMDHPNIARVYDAGTTERGLPYFVMELVDGMPITSYCDAKEMGTREKIELFIPVCQAIQHAHQKGIIHRDIKPSNVLVKQQEANALPKVIDFGLAKALAEPLSDVSAQTQFGSVVGTLDYMSPEQAELGRQDVDTRTDIYSLGALLYELLTGEPPLEYDHSSRPSYLEVLGWIKEKPVSAPSVRNRGHAARPLDREMDWIVLKALEKDRTRRYETANGMVRDLQRYLAGEPVEAGPPSMSYRLGKFARKYRVWIATAAMFVLVLAAGVVVSTWMAVRASQAEAEALAVNQFLQDDLLAQSSLQNQSRAGSKPDPELRVRTLLDRAEQRIGNKFVNQPLVEAAIRHTIGVAYRDLGEYPKAQAQYERALDLRSRRLGVEHADTLKSMTGLAGLHMMRGAYEESEKLVKQALEIQRRLLPKHHPETLSSLHSMALIEFRKGNHAEAARQLEEVVRQQTRVLGEADSATLNTINTLGACYWAIGKYGQATLMLSKVLEGRRRSLGESDPQTLQSMNNLAVMQYTSGNFAEAEKLFGILLEQYSKMRGPDHPSTLTSRENLGELLGTVGRSEEAETVLKDVLERRRRVLGETHPGTLHTLLELGKVYQMQGRLPEAERAYSQSVAGAQKALGPQHPETIAAAGWLAEVQVQQGKAVQAEATLRGVLSAAEKSQKDKWERYRAESRLGACLARQKKFAEAEPLLMHGFEGLHQQLTAVPAYERHAVQKAAQWTAEMYGAWGKKELAEQWRARTAGISH